MRPISHGIATSALVTAIAVAGMVVTAVIQSPGGPPPPVLAGPPHRAPSASPSSGGRVHASTMPVIARPIPSASYSVVLAGYGRSTASAPPRPRSHASTLQPGPSRPAVAAPSPSAQPSAQPQAAGSPSPAVAAPQASPSSCTVTVNVLGVSGCAGIGG